MKFRNIPQVLAAGVVLAFAAFPALAVIDVSAATTSITDSQTASVTVLGAMIGVSGVVWGLKRVKRLLGG